MSTALGYGLGLPFRVSTGFNPAALFAAGEQGAWYDPSDLTTLFQDSAGTTPVTAVEQSVGLMLDKRVPVAQTGYYSGVFDGNGDELSAGSNDAFAFGNGAYTVEFWTYLTAAVSGTHQPSFLCANATGGWIIYNTATNLIVGVRGVSNDYLTTSLTAGVWNHVVAVRSGTGVNQFSIFVNGTRTLNTTDAKNWTVNGPLQIGGITLANYYVTGYMSNVRVVKGTAVYDPAQATLTVPTAPLTAISGTSLLTCQNSTFIDNSGNNFTITAVGDAKTGARNPFGNHAYQSTSTSRPVLRARYNLLTYSEQFDNAAWTRDGGVTVSANSAVAPDGTTTADLVSGTASSGIRQTSTQASNVTNTASVYVRAGTGTDIRLQLRNTVTTTDFCQLSFNLSTEVISFSNGGTGTGATGSATKITVGSDTWYRLTLTGVASTASNVAGIYVWGVSGTFYLWGAQLIVTNSLTSNTYQRIAAATDYNTTGFLPYLAFDGTDDSLLTNSVNFTATDKMTVWAGVRKLSDAATFGVIGELSSATSTNAGAFVMTAPAGSASTYYFATRGSINGSAVTSPANYAAPITNVLTGVADIAADQNLLRINGTQVGSDVTDQGTGNYGNYPLYIGRRNNASLPLNGNLFSLIIRGAQSTASQISSTETWVAQKAGVSL